MAVRKSCSFVIHEADAERFVNDDEKGLTLSIGAVSRATGIPANTLRTWERRYGFPRPVRTDGGQRVYAATVVPHLTDIARALDRGLRPRDVLTASRDDLRRWTNPDAPTVDGDDIEPLLVAVRSLDADGLDRACQVLWALRGGVPFLDGVAAPFLARVGAAWAAGDLEVFQEHFASEVLRSFLARIWRPLADHARGPIVVCATPPGERHDLGLHFAATTLALSGRRLAFLGADVPARDIALAVVQSNAEAVAVSLSSATDPSVTRPQLLELRRVLPATVAMLVGGSGAPDLDGVLTLHSCAELDHWARPTA
jgi:methylmalonyl-CoA mutase cobalamin-binding subunit